jgi:hypothetical protein
MIVLWCTLEAVISDELRMQSGSWDESGSVVGHVVGSSGSDVSHRRLDQSQGTVNYDESEKSEHSLTK